MEEVKVADLMKSPKGVLRPSQTAFEAALAMREADISSVLVVEQGTLLGIVTEHDIVQRVVANGLDAKKVTLADIMSRPIIFTTPQATILQAAKLMTQYRIRRLPVVDRGRVVGIVTADDIAHYLAKLKDYSDEFLNALARYSRPPIEGPYA
ncbi:MAG: CBS domain-containing protein [Nitrososphaerota archaeon]